MENILLFNVEINPREILSRQPNLEVSVNAHDYMTNKESEQFQQLLADASQIVIGALMRQLNESNSNNDYEDDEEEWSEDNE